MFDNFGIAIEDIIAITEIIKISSIRENAFLYLLLIFNPYI